MCVILPIYKASPNETEMVSFARCIEVLHKYPISLCTYEGLDISYYEDRLKEAGVDYMIDYFDEKYFRSTDGYNELHLSANFYKHYLLYEYMFIYQLDAYVLEDQLSEWMDKGYDYVGAPWLTDDGKAFAGVGNGGFCLKKTAWWYRELRWPIPVWSPKTLRQLFPIKDIRTCLSFMARCLGSKNTVRQIYKDRRYLYNEDGLPNMINKMSWRHKPQLPTEAEALQFSFERFPSKMYELNHRQLPMGCHAWEKYEFDSFWKKHIKG